MLQHFETIQSREEEINNVFILIYHCFENNNTNSKLHTNNTAFRSIMNTKHNMHN